MCFYYHIKPQVLFYDGNYSHFDDRELDIFRKHHIQYFILKAGDYVHYQTNDNGPKMKLKSLYVNAIMNWMRHHGTLKFTSSQMDYVLVETWEAFKISSTIIIEEYFKNKHLLPLSWTSKEKTTKIDLRILNRPTFGNIMIQNE